MIDDEHEALLSQAFASLKANQLQTAHDLYSKVLRLYKSDTEVCVKALEGRAAVLEKQKMYEQAIIDAKMLIHLAPVNKTGYLRLGKVLRLLKRYDEAIRVYEKGILNSGKVPEFDRQILATRNQIENLVKSGQRENTSFDIFKILPKEMIYFVLKKLTFADRLQVFTMSKAALQFRISSKQYRRTLLLDGQNKQIHKLFKVGAIFRKIYLIGKGAPTLKQFKRLIDKGLPARQINRIKFADMDLTDWNENILEMFPNLRSLRFTNCILSPHFIEYLPQIKLEDLIIKNCSPNTMNTNLLADWCNLSFEPLQFVYSGKDQRYGPFLLLLKAGLCFEEIHTVNSLFIRYFDAFLSLPVPMPNIQRLYIFDHSLQLSMILNLLSIFPNLEELGIFYLSEKIILPGKIIQSIINVNPRLSVLSLPFLQNLSPDKKKSLTSSHTFIRFIFDYALAERMVNRFWTKQKRPLKLCN